MMTPTKPAYLSPEMRLQEVANILARGIVRMRDKNAKKTKKFRRKTTIDLQSSTYRALI